MSSIVSSGELEDFWPRVAKQTQLLLGALVSSARQQAAWVVPREPTAKGKGKGKTKSQAEVAKKKAKFESVALINPDSKGINLQVKVLSVEGGTAVVGDASGVVSLNVRGDEQVSLVKVDASLVLRNALVRMDNPKGYIRLEVDKWGKIESCAEAHTFVPKQEKDVSATEWELAAV